MQEPYPTPPEPIVLQEGGETKEKKVSTKKGHLATFGVLFSGWLIGNMLVVALLLIVGLVFLGSDKLFSIPSLVSDLLHQTKVFISLNR